MNAVATRTVLLAGASGLTGSHVLDALLEANDIARVIAVTRRALGREHPRLANRIVQFERLASQLQGVRCDAALCCLGTTLREAGSQQRMRAVDVDSVLAFASVARSAGARRFVVVSSVGADPTARNFYLRTKGDMEAALVPLGFESLDILQPSLLLGWRQRPRPLELVAMAALPPLNPLLRGRFSVYRAITARELAAAMLGALRSGRRGVQRYTWPGLMALARAGSTGRAAGKPAASGGG
ncbi:MAG: NAD(P)H-binding protein [Proteobacteria bacterium]|nr:NAD(P)H-binding protein [Pseudomonadota bacterium]